jgi:hypothetical protein
MYAPHTTTTITNINLENARLLMMLSETANALAAKAYAAAQVTAAAHSPFYHSAGEAIPPSFKMAQQSAKRSEFAASKFSHSKVSFRGVGSVRSAITTMPKRAKRTPLLVIDSDDEDSVAASSAAPMPSRVAASSAAPMPSRVAASSAAPMPSRVAASSAAPMPSRVAAASAATSVLQKRTKYAPLLETDSDDEDSVAASSAEPMPSRVAASSAALMPSRVAAASVCSETNSHIYGSELTIELSFQAFAKDVNLSLLSPEGLKYFGSDGKGFVTVIITPKKAELVRNTIISQMCINNNEKSHRKSTIFSIGITQAAILAKNEVRMWLSPSGRQIMFDDLHKKGGERCRLNCQQRQSIKRYNIITDNTIICKKCKLPFIGEPEKVKCDHHHHIRAYRSTVKQPYKFYVVSSVMFGVPSK